MHISLRNCPSYGVDCYKVYVLQNISVALSLSKVMKILQEVLENARTSGQTNATNLPYTNSVYYVAHRRNNKVRQRLEFKIARVTSQSVVCRSETLTVKLETKP